MVSLRPRAGAALQRGQRERQRSESQEAGQAVLLKLRNCITVQVLLARLQQPRCALLRPSPHVGMGSLRGHKTSNSRWCSAPDGDRSPSSMPPRCDPPPAA